MKDYYYLFLAFLLWSSSSAIVVNFKNVFPPFQSASIVIVIATVIWTGFLLLFDRSKVKALFDCDLMTWLKIAMLGFFGFCLYPVFYFYGLHSERPVEANVINYFWPLATLIFSFTFRVDQVTLKKLASIVFGSFGVVIAASTIPILRGNEEHILSFSFQDIPAYLLAGFGSLSFGLYSALRNKFIFQSENRYTRLDIKSRFVGFLWISCLFHITVNLFNLGGHVVNIEYQLSLKGFFFIVFYSIFNFSFAYYLWARAEKLPSFHTSLMAFLIPPMSAIFLSAFNNLPLNFNSIFGLLLIVIGLAIYQDYQNYITPLMGFIITYNLLGLLRISFPGESSSDEPSINFSIVEISVAIFSILASFILARTIQLCREERVLFIEIEDTLVRMAYLSDLDAEIVQSIDSFMIYMVDSEACFDVFDVANLIYFEREVSKHISEIVRTFQNRFSSQEQITLFRGEIDSLQEKISKWKFLKGESLSVFEWLILGILIFSTVSLIFVSHSSNRWHDFSSVTIGSCLVLFIFAIRDYDLRRPTTKSSFILMTQRISNLAQNHPYLPYDLMISTRITKRLEETVRSMLSTKIRTMRNGVMEEVEFKQTPTIYQSISYVLGLALLLLVSYILLK